MGKEENIEGKKRGKTKQNKRLKKAVNIKNSDQKYRKKK